jgi:acetylornithine deacetylase/succinyl-diaminopimelate desuccinylase-like protein
MSQPVTEKEVVELVSELVKIESVTPWLIETGSGEGAVASFMASWLGDAGAEVEVVEVQAGRPNVLARLRGSQPGPTLCLNAHSDTVGFDNWADRALSPRLEGGRLYGLGSCDDKGMCAAAMFALRSVARSGRELKGDLLVACVADEEGVSIGSEHLAAMGGIDATLVIEPQPLAEVVVEHQGFGWIDVIVHGVPAHGSAPEKGVDAIVHMAEVVTRLHELNKTHFEARPDPMNGRTVFHTGTIAGGTDYATYPSSVTLGIEIGTQPGEHLSNRVADIETIFGEVAALDPRFKGEVVVRLDREPFKAEGHESLLAAWSQAMIDVTGNKPRETGMNAWADSGLMQGAGIPTLLVGAEGGNLHAPDEWVSVSELTQLCAVLENAVLGYLS